MLESPVELLLCQLDAAYDRKSWHGPNLRGSVRRVELEVALWRPAAGRRCIWEIAVHAAYWKYATRRRLLGEKRGSFPIKGSNWFPVPARPSAADWKSQLTLLDDTHRQLRAAIAALRPADLDHTPPGASVNNRMLLSGIIAHDVYHAGQIQLLKRLVRHSIK